MMRSTRYQAPVCTCCVLVCLLSSVDCPLSAPMPHPPPANYTRTADQNVSSPSTQHSTTSSAQAALGIVNALVAPKHGLLLSALFTCFSCMLPSASEAGGVNRPRSGALVELRIFIFLLKVLGWCIPCISGGSTSTPPPSITCGTVQLFFDLLLHLVIFMFARFSRCFLTLQLLPSNLISANTILNFFVIFASFFGSKLNFLQFSANLPPAHYLRNGPALDLFFNSSFTNLFWCSHEISSYQRSQLISAWLIIISSAPPSSALQRYLAQQRSAVQCRTVPCRAVP